MKVIRKFLMCSCASESIVLEKYKGEEEIYLSIFGRGLNIKRYSVLDRVRHIWQILRTGFPYTDEIVLNKKDAVTLAKEINNLCK